jgi:hypothetical protein
MIRCVRYGSRIQDPVFSHPESKILGSKKHRISDPARSTDFTYGTILFAGEVYIVQKVLRIV